VRRVTYVKSGGRLEVIVYDRVPINPITRNEVAFDCLVMDCLGPLFPSQKLEYNISLLKKHYTSVILVIFHVIPHNLHYIRNYVQV